MKIRINKFIASSGVVARRKADELIKNGAVWLNGKKASLGDIVDTETDHVIYHDREIVLEPDYIYYAVNKPKDVLSSVSDDRGRRVITDLVRSRVRLFPVGRLDYDSTGLILLTNDGELALKLTHPKFHLPKTYIVETNKLATPEQIEKLKGGVVIDAKRTHKAEITKLAGKNLRFTLYEGRKRQIKEMCKALGLMVVSLERVKIGPIELGSLKPGSYRALTPQEIESLKSAR